MLHLMALCNLLLAAGLLLASAAARRRVTGELFALRLSIAPGTGLSALGEVLVVNYLIYQLSYVSIILTALGNVLGVNYIMTEHYL